MSKNDNLVSMSGAPIFRYTDGEREWELKFLARFPHKYDT